MDIQKKKVIYNDFAKRGVKVNDLVAKYHIGHYKIREILDEGIHIAKIEERLKRGVKEEVVVPNFEGVPLYKTIKAWNNEYQLNEYEILKRLKNDIR